MEFTLSDIQRLYGDSFFYLKEEDPPVQTSHVVQEAQSHLFTEGEAITWKMKPDSQLALVLKREEFKDKEATSQLKQWVLLAEIAPQQVGFGLMPAEANAIHFNDMPVKVAIAFGPPEAPPMNSINLGEKDIFILPAIHELLAAPDGQAQVLSTMKQAKFLIPKI